MRLFSYFYRAVGKILKRVRWNRNYTYNGPTGGSNNIDGTPMIGIVDIKGNPHGVID